MPGAVTWQKAKHALAAVRFTFLPGAGSWMWRTRRRASSHVVTLTVSSWARPWRQSPRKRSCASTSSAEKQLRTARQSDADVAATTSAGVSSSSRSCSWRHRSSTVVAKRDVCGAALSSRRTKASRSLALTWWTSGRIWAHIAKMVLPGTCVTSVSSRSWHSDGRSTCGPGCDPASSPTGDTDVSSMRAMMAPMRTRTCPAEACTASRRRRPRAATRNPSRLPRSALTISHKWLTRAILSCLLYGSGAGISARAWHRLATTLRRGTSKVIVSSALAMRVVKRCTRSTTRGASKAEVRIWAMELWHKLGVDSIILSTRSRNCSATSRCECRAMVSTSHCSDGMKSST
mmetsp:Transcript_36628/g.112860  ORF Transcript_36628/g.112860 Transcript_36628/m.112860 type:complete len:346 (+) Transcript_36628:809-1846(+)